MNQAFKDIYWILIINFILFIVPIVFVDRLFFLHL